jgi:UDP-N-acetylmuramoylalanine--D-glutamate ligase
MSLSEIIIIFQNIISVFLTKNFHILYELCISAPIKNKVHHLIFMGADNSKLENFFANKNIPFTSCNSLESAVQAAYKVAVKGDTVLLSPCCASFDLFKNYEDRGRKFKDAVRAL